MTNAEIIAAYNEGKTAGQIAQLTGRTRNAIVGILNRAIDKGYDVRAGKIMSEADAIKALRLRDAEWTIPDIAKLFGKSISRMTQIFKECDYD